MQRNKIGKPATHESRASLIPPYLDEDPDIELTLPEPDAKAISVNKVKSGTRNFSARPRKKSHHRDSF